MKYKVKRLELGCPFCERKGLKSRSGLVGHIQLQHPESYASFLDSPGTLPPSGEMSIVPPSNGGDEAAAQGAIPSAAPSSQTEPMSKRVLQLEVDTLELTRKRRNLLKELNDGQPQHIPDIMERAGLGSLKGEAEQLAQKRALGIAGEQPESWLSQLFKNPTALQTAIAGLKGILGVSDGGGLGALKQLKDVLGIDLPELIKSGQQRVSTKGLDFEGFSLPSDVSDSTFQKILDYKGKVEAAKLEADSKNLMANSLQSLTSALMPMVAEKFGAALAGGGAGIAGGGGGGSVSRQPEQRESGEIDCPICHFINPVPADFPLGQLVKCGGMVDSLNGKIPCSEAWERNGPEDQQRKPARMKQVKVREEPPLPESIPCESCSQLISILGKPLGSELECPICHSTQILMSSDIALPPAEPPEEKKSYVR